MTFLGKVENMMEKVLGVTEVRKKFSSIVEQVQYEGDICLISRYGKPAAAVVPIEAYETWRQQREEFFDLIRDMQEEADLSAEEADRVARDAVTATRSEG
jgi:prevent-host-death family protein